MKYCMYREDNGKGDWRWYLRAANNKKIANSGEGYKNKKDCEDAIALVKDSKGAPVEEC